MMSYQSLRDALEQLAKERDSVSGHTASDYYIRPYELFDLLAAHPAEPALVVSDEAVEEAAKAIYEYDVQPGDWVWSKVRTDDNRIARGRAALEAAAPLLDPRPMPTQEQIDRLLTGHYYDASWSKERQGFRCVCGWLGEDHVQHVRAEMLALLNGAES